ncbi:MAG: toxin-antitoxin system protein [Slackia sp.]|uniref:toxin-antitoxin system protein n=1 Tax=uncultured Slackia sp. TaxID=665903 RepID=UPI002804B1AE|nr:toxin-antitoxin system protein [uncultured Slackia sp.]MDU6011370.1 toxin-antitoxin system protein [Slackia sp.]
MAMRFEKEKVSAEGSKMAIGSLGIDSAGNAALERIEDELDLQAWEVAKAAFDVDPETISAADIASKYL